MTGNYIDLMIVFTTLILSVLCIIGGGAMRFFYHREMALEYLGWGTLVAAAWNFSNSAAGQYLFPAAADYLAFYTTLLLPFPFFLYLNVLQQKRYQKLYRVMGITVLVETVVFAFLQLTGLGSTGQNAFVMLLVLSLFLTLMFLTILTDLCQKRIRDYLLGALGLTFVWFVCAARLIPYFFLERKLRDNALLPVGLIFLLLLAMINTVHELIQMERQRQEALAASDAKGRFLANMSHEIRTPINAVLGMDTMILRETKETQIKEYALDIQNAGQSLLALINDILDLSKIESGKLELLAEEYDFSSLIHDIMNMISMKAQNKGLSVSLSIGEDLPSRLWGDDVRLRQVLINLMNNAVKYTEQGGVTLSVRQAPASGADMVSLTFHVTDTGIGIKEEDLSKLFSAFERIEEQRNRNIEGTGLGMSITTQLLELMGTSLQVDSVYGKGSDFYFTLEQKIVNAEPIGNLEERIRRQAKEYSYQTLLTAPDAHLLVVDDNAMNRRVFKNLLKATLVQIDEAGSGMECLTLTQKNRYDLIFLDHMMPDMDGIETLHRLMADTDSPCRNVPVIALTANAVAGAREMYLNEGFHSFLSKPINPNKLEQLLLDLLPEEKIVPGAPPELSLDMEKTAGAEIGDTEIPVHMETNDGLGNTVGTNTYDGTENTAGTNTYARTENTVSSVPYGITNKNTSMKLSSSTKKTVGAESYTNLKSTADDYEFPEIDGIDWSYARLHFREPDFLLETIRDFYRAMDTDHDMLLRYLSQIEDADAEALRQFRVKVHSMKSSAAMIGATSLSGVAKMLEYAARDGRTDILFSVTPYFLEEWRRTKERLRPLADAPEEHADTQKPDADLKIIQEYFPMLEQAMQRVDIDTADEIMRHLDSFQYPKPVRALMEELGLSVTNLDASQTSEIIGKLQTAIRDY